MYLKNKIAIVTGGSQGIGLAISQQLAQQGAHVVIVSRDHEKAARAVDLIKSQDGLAKAVCCDISNIASVQAMVTDIFEDYGRIDILVNNAGVTIPKTVAKTLESDWDKTMDVNLKAAFFLSQAVLNIMKKQGSGKVICVSSVADAKPFPKSSVYCMSKAAMTMMVKSLAFEYAQFGVNINAVCPGNIATPMNQHLQNDADFVKHLKAHTPSCRAYISPNEVASAVLFLASDQASAIHGAALPVDDGWMVAM